MAQAIKDVMTPDPVCVGPHDSAADAARRMRDVASGAILVVDGDRPVGIVSIGDLALIRDETSALADISGAPANQ